MPHFIRLFLILPLLLCLSTLSAFAQDSKVFNASAFELENGLRVIVIPNHIAPVVTHMVWYGVGAADEPPGRSGIAHFLEHLMFKGSAVIGGDALGPGEFSKIVKMLGGNENAFTSYDYTAFFQSVAVENLETVMRMEAGRMRGLSPPPEEILSERKVILEERRQRTDNNPENRLMESLNAALYPNHPYGTPIIGWMHEMEALDWETAKNFYDRWYGPNNAILVVSGDVEPDFVYQLAAEIYGPLARGELPPRTRTKMPNLAGHTKILFQEPSIRQAQLLQLFKAPSFRQNKSHSLALQVLEEILGGGPTSRLYQALVVKKELATNIAFYYQGASWNESEIQIQASLAPGIAPEDLESAIEEELQKLISEGVSESELHDALKRMQAEAIYARDSVRGPAMVIGQALITGASLEDIEYWPRDIESVTAGQIQEVAGLYLNKDAQETTRFVTGFLLPEGEEKQ